MKFSILNGNNVLGGNDTTQKQWDKFLAARSEYYRKVDRAIKAGKPNNPRLGHPNP